MVNPMKGLVVAGGTVDRLRPSGPPTPPPLVPVANRPVLLRCLDSLREAGIREVAIVVGDRGDAVRAAVGDGCGLRITWLVQDEPRGVAHCVRLAGEFLGDDDFVLHLGDNVVVGGIGAVVDRFRQGRCAVRLLVAKVSNPADYGVAELDHDGRVVGVAEKPAEPRSDLAVVGVYLLTPVIHKAVRAVDGDLTDAIQWLVGRGHDVRADVFGGYWRDTGRFDDALECNRVLLEATEPGCAGEIDERTQLVGPVTVEAGARVVRSRIVGPAVIGAGTTVVDSYVGPYTALGRDCLVSGAGIEYSIVLDRVSVRHVRRIHGSIIGRSAEVSLSAGEMARHRLVIGDGTRVEVAA